MPGIIIPDPKGGLVLIHAQGPDGNPIALLATPEGYLEVTIPQAS